MQTKWYENFYILKEYLLNNSLTTENITGKTRIQNKPIGKWFTYQCDKYIAQTTLTEEQRKLLESIDIQKKIDALIEKRKTASPRKTTSYQGTWNDKYEIAKREIGKGVEIKRGYITREDFNLGEWVKAQRSAFKNQKLSDERVKKLNELGLLDNIRPDYLTWNEWYNLCLQIKTELGTINVPVAYIYKNNAVGKWLQTQRLS